MDITGKIGDLFPSEKPEWPMYSYSRPAYLFWQGVADEMFANGATPDQVREFLSSKTVRHMLDAHGDEARNLGREFYRRITGG